MKQDTYLKYDLYRYFYESDQTTDISLFSKIKIILLTQAVWAIIVYRAGFWCVRNIHTFGRLPRFLLPFLTICQKAVEIATGIELPFTAQIGRGLYIGHFGQIILSTRTVMGEFCNLSQGVTIGQAGRGNEQYTPIIGDRVYIAPGAKIFGKLIIGNDVAIGANAVVTKDLPDNAVAVGVPAKIIHFESSRDFVVFNRKRMGIGESD
jgi:serine O-acetyltransferase